MPPLGVLWTLLITINAIGGFVVKNTQKPVTNIFLTSLEEYKAIENDAEALKAIRILGNTSCSDHNHPVVEAVIKRWSTGSKPGKRVDGNKIALCIEGGGMRGCVAAGASGAINFLGLNDAVDIVYGSSAGSMVATYFISRQLSGVQIYHDVLPAAGSSFINKSNLLRAMGLHLDHFKAFGSLIKGTFIKPRPNSRPRGATAAGISSDVSAAVAHSSKASSENNGSDDSRGVIFSPNNATGATTAVTTIPSTEEVPATDAGTTTSSAGAATTGATSAGATTATSNSPSKHMRKEVINLDYLLEEVMVGTQRLDWDTFSANEATQPLRVVASSVRDMQAVLLSRDNGNFHDLPSLLNCIRSSMLVPGVAGPLQGITEQQRSPFTLNMRLRSQEAYNLPPTSSTSVLTTTATSATSSTSAVGTLTSARPGAVSRAGVVAGIVDDIVNHVVDDMLESMVVEDLASDDSENAFPALDPWMVADSLDESLESVSPTYNHNEFDSYLEESNQSNDNSNRNRNNNNNSNNNSDSSSSGSGSSDGGCDDALTFSVADKEESEPLKPGRRKRRKWGVRRLSTKAQYSFALFRSRRRQRRSMRQKARTSDSIDDTASNTNTNANASDAAHNDDAAPNDAAPNAAARNDAGSDTVVGSSQVLQGSQHEAAARTAGSVRGGASTWKDSRAESNKKLPRDGFRLFATRDVDSTDGATAAVNLHDSDPEDRKEAPIENALEPQVDVNPLADALLCEPIPYRSAVKERATHMIVLRTRPDPCPIVLKQAGVYEKVIAKRFFKKYKEQKPVDWMEALQHHRIYAEDILRLNEGAKGHTVEVKGREVHLLPVAITDGSGVSEEEALDTLDSSSSVPGPVDDYATVSELVENGEQSDGELNGELSDGQSEGAKDIDLNWDEEDDDDVDDDDDEDDEEEDDDGDDDDDDDDIQCEDGITTSMDISRSEGGKMSSLEKIYFKAKRKEARIAAKTQKRADKLALKTFKAAERLRRKAARKAKRMELKALKAQNRKLAKRKVDWNNEMAESLKEVSQLEMDREKVLLGMRAGARRVLQLFLPAMRAYYIQKQGSVAASSAVPVVPGDVDTNSYAWLDSSVSVETIVEMMFPLSTLDRPVSKRTFSTTTSFSQGMDNQLQL